MQMCTGGRLRREVPMAIYIYNTRVRVPRYYAPAALTTSHAGAGPSRSARRSRQGGKSKTVCSPNSRMQDASENGYPSSEQQREQKGEPAHKIVSFLSPES